MDSFDSGVRALIIYDEQLIAGGVFTTASGNTVNYIAKWDGYNWQPMGSGMNDDVDALTVYDGQLIAGGWFTTAGGNSANRIASWDGSSMLSAPMILSWLNPGHIPERVTGISDLVAKISC